MKVWWRDLRLGAATSSLPKKIIREVVEMRDFGEVRQEKIVLDL